MTQLSNSPFIQSLVRVFNNLATTGNGHVISKELLQNYLAEIDQASLGELEALVQRWQHDRYFPEHTLVEKLLTHLNKLHCYRAALEIYDTCLKRKNFAVTEFLFANALHAVAKSEPPSVEHAESILLLAEQRGLVNTVVYTNMLNVLAKSSSATRFTRAVEIYHLAENNQWVDSIFYQSLLDVLIQGYSSTQATCQKILAIAHKKGFWPPLTLYKNKDQGNYEVDLHGYGFGNALLEILDLLQNPSLTNRPALHISFIIGQGKDKYRDDELRVLQRVIIELERFLPNLPTIPFIISARQENETNPGVWEVELRSKRTLNSLEESQQLILSSEELIIVATPAFPRPSLFNYGHHAFSASFNLKQETIDQAGRLSFAAKTLSKGC